MSPRSNTDSFADRNRNPHCDPNGYGYGYGDPDRNRHSDTYSNSFGHADSVAYFDGESDAYAEA